MINSRVAGNFVSIINRETERKMEKGRLREHVALFGVIEITSAISSLMANYNRVIARFFVP